eukprot:TRINITY_DN759_c0_g1_i2.p1 TRINITY_DN759_c0_g1~~TRINITY_DN759_c0_g1_i2.p1  ORF type:complete len:249 (-),score=40.19 TRINITY_DN759_c0_g1_i2:275-1021(-)
MERPNGCKRRLAAPPGLEDVRGGVEGFEANRCLDPDLDNIKAVTEGRQQADTLILKNLPIRCTQKEIEKALADLCFPKEFLRFVYLPMRSKTAKKRSNRGYCFVSFKTPELAGAFRLVYQDFKLEQRVSDKAISIESANIQGLSPEALGNLSSAIIAEKKQKNKGSRYSHMSTCSTSSSNSNMSTSCSRGISSWHESARFSSGSGSYGREPLASLEHVIDAAPKACYVSHRISSDPVSESRPPILVRL